MNNVFYSVAALLLIASCAPAQVEGPIRWTKITLTNQFYSEGANFGDFNHDGKMDITSGPFWYEGPDFSPEKQHEFMPVQSHKPDDDYSNDFLTFVYDFNGDGWDDILVIGFHGEDASWYENPKGKEGHWVRHKIFDHVDNESPGFGDLLKEGKPVLICSTEGRLGYARPDWSDPAKRWTWHPISEKKDYQRFTHGLGWGDVNGDGRNDLLTAQGWYEQPTSLQADPAWTFHPADFGPGGAQMYVCDVNGAGRPDVITSLEAHGYGLAWFEQKPDGTFDAHLIVGRTPQDNPQGVVITEMHAIDVIDINGDGLPDIVTGKRHFAHGSHGPDPDSLAPSVLYWFELKRDNGKAHYVAHLID
ncbi:MAG: FG-GAP repeat domain-containing protein, partial [Candidatus Saccharimonadales bacterium]